MSSRTLVFSVTVVFLLRFAESAYCEEESTATEIKGPIARSELTEVEKLREQARFAEAAHVTQGLLDKEIKASGKTSDRAAAFGKLVEELTTLQNLIDRVAQLKQAQEFEEAERLACQVLALEQSHYGTNHAKVDECKKWRNSLHQSNLELQKLWAQTEEEVQSNLRSGKLTEAIGLTVAILKYKRRTLGNQHTEVANALLQLARREELDGRPEMGVTRYKEAIETLTEVLGESHWRVTEARFDYQTALQMRKLSRRQQLRLIKIQADYWDVHEEKSLENLKLSEAKLKSDVEYVKKTVGTKNRFYFLALLDLAHVYRSLGRLAEADRALTLATDGIAEVAGKSHPIFYVALSRWATVRGLLSDHAAAVGYAQESTEITKQMFGQFHEQYLVLLRTYSQQLYEAGRHTESLEQMQELLRLHLETRGRVHPDTGGIYSDLAHCYLTTNQFDLAKKHAYEASQIVRESKGKETSEYLNILNLIAMLEEGSGNQQASRLFEELVEISGRLYGHSHYRHIGFLSSAAGHYQKVGLHEKAAELLDEVITAQRNQLDEDFAAQSERHQLIKQSATRGTLFGFVTCCVELGDRDSLVHKRLSSWKGSVSRQQGFAAGASDTEFSRRLRQNLQQVSAELSSIIYGRDNRAEEVPQRVEIQPLWRKLGDLEQQLAEEARRTATHHLTEHDDLSSLIPNEAALIDFYCYNHLTPHHNGRLINNKRELRLLAFVLRPNEPVKMISLGPLAKIQPVVDAWRQLLQAGRGESPSEKSVANSSPQAQLRELLWSPLKPHLKDVDLIFICPDGPLNQIPFAALPGSEPDRYIIDDFGIVTIPYPQWMAGRRESSPTRNQDRASMLLIGDVDFGQGVRSGTIGSRMASGTFSPLPGTAVEIKALADLFTKEFQQGTLTQATHQSATEALIRAESPKHQFLHFATHGFYVKENPTLLQQSNDDERGRDLVRYLEAYTPELLSGVALTGANRSPQETQTNGQDDGILTALELSTLDLRNVELAVLSACESALGQEETGEGMLGLQRALQVAGVRTAITSLWKVDDTATQILMTEFYQNLWQKRMSRIEALRQAQLTMLEQYDPKGKNLRARGLKLVDLEKSKLRRLPPYYWAPFCLSGEWRE